MRTCHKQVARETGPTPTQLFGLVFDYRLTNALTMIMHGWASPLWPSFNLQNETFPEIINPTRYGTSFQLFLCVCSERVLANYRGVHMNTQINAWFMQAHLRGDGCRARCWRGRGGGCVQGCRHVGRYRYNLQCVPEPLQSEPSCCLLFCVLKSFYAHTSLLKYEQIARSHTQLPNHTISLRWLCSGAGTDNGGISVGNK